MYLIEYNKTKTKLYCLFQLTFKIASYQLNFLCVVVKILKSENGLMTRVWLKFLIFVVNQKLNTTKLMKGNLFNKKKNLCKFKQARVTNLTQAHRTWEVGQLRLIEGITYNWFKKIQRFSIIFACCHHNSKWSRRRGRFYKNVWINSNGNIHRRFSS